MGSKKKFKVAIDIGSSKIAGMVYKKDKTETVQILSSQILVSKGLKRGMVTNLEEAESAIMKMIYALENDSGQIISRVDVSVSSSAKSFFINHKISILDKSVEQHDIKNLINKTTSKFNKQDLHIIYADPIEFFADDKKIENPRGIVCNTLGCTLHVIAISSYVLENIRKSFAKSNVKIDKFVHSALASGLACLPLIVRKNGGIIFDMGSHTTSFCIFLKGKALYTNYIPLGSHLITTDIAKIFSLDNNIAEKLKIMFGKVGVTKDANQLIDLSILMRQYPKDINITMGELSNIIDSRLTEIIQMIKAKYDMINVNTMLAKNIYITGGGSEMQGIEVIFKRIFKRLVYKSRLTQTIDSQDDKAIGLTACVGIAHFEENKLNQQEDTTLLHNVLEWMKANI